MDNLRNARRAGLRETAGCLLLLSALICGLLPMFPSPALAGSIWDESFQISLTRGAGVSDMALQADGRIVVVGNFSEVEGVPRQGIARLNADGSLSSDFNPGALFNAEALLVAAQPDGKVLVGGITRDSRFAVKRFNSDGSPDSSFDFGAGIEPSWYSGENTYDMLLLPNGQILVAGHFNRVQGQTVRCVARFRSDGRLDPSFNPNANFGNFDTVSHLYLRQNGDVFFTAVYDGGIITYFGFGRLTEDGNTDPTIGLNTGGWSRVDTLSFASEGRLILFGEFYGLDGDSPRYALRLNPDHTVDGTYSLPLSFWPAVTKPLWDGRTLLLNIGGSDLLLNTNGEPDLRFADDGRVAAGDAVLQPDGRFLATGWGSPLTNGEANFGVVRLLDSGVLDASFSMPGGMMAACGGSQELILQPDGRILLRSDDARFANGHPVGPPLMRFLPNGDIDTNFVYSGPNLFAPASLAAETDGKVLLGSLDRVFRLESAGEPDVTFGYSMVCETATRLVKLPDGGTLVQSEISTLTGCQVWERNVVSIRKLRADGSLDPEFTPVSPDPSHWECVSDAPGSPCGLVYSEVRHLLPCGSNGAFYLAGRFHSLSGMDRTNLARLLPNGQMDPEFQPVMAAPVAGFAALADSGAAVLTDDGTLSVLDSSGAIRNSVMLPGGMPQGLQDIWFAPDETFVLGSFPSDDGALVLQRISLDGALVGTCRFPAYRGQLRGVMQPDGNLIFSGLFPREGGTDWSGIRRLKADAIRSFRLRLLPSRAETLILEMEGPPGWSFSLQRSLDLTAWQTMPVRLTATAPDNRLEISVQNNAQFFRAVVAQPASTPSPGEGL